MLNKHLGFALNLIALLLFVPGILLPMFALNMEMTAQISASSLTSTLISKELSLINTVEELWQGDRLLVASLIFLFSICIPVAKTILVTISYWKRNTKLEVKLLNFVAKISKWSMADVFVVAIFLAILSTTHAQTADQQQFALFGFRVDLLISSETISAAGAGFYYFTGYCLLALLGTHFSQRSLSVNLKSNR